MTNTTARVLQTFVTALVLAAGCTVGEPGPDGGPIPIPDAGPPQDAWMPPPPDSGPPPTCTPEGMGSTLGQACVRNADCSDHCVCNGEEQCSDGVCVAGVEPCTSEVACATGTCEEGRGCVFVGDDSLCDDGEVCNGAELCDPTQGCRPGAPPTCNDANTCTVDFCQPGVGCVFEPFDGDGDGSPSRSCGGDDCNDRDMTIGPSAPEVCDNLVDDDCDGAIDIEDDECRADNDDCARAEDITPAGLGTFRYRRSTVGFVSDTTLACTSSTTDTRRTAPDAVFVLRLTEMRDVVIGVEGLGNNAGVMLRTLAACGAGPDLKCSAPSSSSVEPVIRRRRLPVGEYAIIVKTRTEGAFTLALTVGEASSTQSDLCAPDTLDISAGGTFTGPLEDHDYFLSCRSGTTLYPEAAFQLIVPAGEFRDVRLRGTTRTPTGTSSTPWVQLTSACGDASSTFSECDSGTTSAPAEVFVRGVPEGTYYVLLESTSTTAGVGSYELVAEVTPSAGRTPGDSCEAGVPVVVAEGVPGSADIGLLDATPDAGAFCGANRAGYRDAFFQLTLAEERDVLVRTTSTVRHWVGVSETCGAVSSPFQCMTSSLGIAERRFTRLRAGTHFINVSTLAEAGTVQAEIVTFPPTPRPANDACSTAATIPDGTPVDVDLTAYSDDASFTCGGTGALDAFYTFTLATSRFVTLRAEGAVSLAVLPSSCTATATSCVTGVPPQIAQVFEPGTYYVAIESPPLEAGAVRVRFTTADP